MAKFMTLFVEDDAFQREVLAEVLKDEGFEVVECSTAEAAELVISTSGTELRTVIAVPTSTSFSFPDSKRRGFPKRPASCKNPFARHPT
jgi:CheY-like chemotaxis protein